MTHLDLLVVSSLLRPFCRVLGSCFRARNVLTAVHAPPVCCPDEQLCPLRRAREHAHTQPMCHVPCVTCDIRCQLPRLHRMVVASWLLELKEGKPFLEQFIHRRKGCSSVGRLQSGVSMSVLKATGSYLAGGCLALVTAGCSVVAAVGPPLVTR